MSPTDEKTHSHRIFACFSYIFLDPGLLFLLAGELFALLPSGSVLCTTDVTPRTDFSRSSPHFLFWHQVFGIPCLGPFTPVTHISHSSIAVLKQHDEKYFTGESVFQVTVPWGKPMEGLGIEHCGRCTEIMYQSQMGSRGWIGSRMRLSFQRSFPVAHTFQQGCTS